MISGSAIPSWPLYEEDEIQAVERVLRSGRVNYWTGDEGRGFERDFAQYIGCRHSVAVANGTVALELALHGLEIGAGDEVIVPSRTFIASASAAALRGAVPVPADIDPYSQNITVDTIRAVLSPRTRAIIAVHLAGWPCDMDPILQIASEHGLKVIEDCAQALGARYKGRLVGSLGDAAAFSFCQDKILSTGGEGGMLVTDNETVWKRAWSYKDHGKDYEAVFHRQHPPGFRWLHESFGTNWRMTEMQAVIGRVQMKKIEARVAQRRRNADFLNRRLKNLDALLVPVPPSDLDHAYYKYYVFVRPERLSPGNDRDSLMRAIEAAGIPCQSGSCSEIYMEKAFISNSLGPKTAFPAARQLGQTSLMFPVHSALGERHMERISEVIANEVRRASLQPGIVGQLNIDAGT